MPGILYVVATPIGNLEDITLRALRLLREADLIAAEDTRVTRKLLSHFDVHTPLTSCHQHTRVDKTESLAARLAAGSTLVLVTDAGTPGVSDPGGELIAAALSQGTPVVPVPGASAALAALVASGLPTNRFAFEGFPPRARSDRHAFFGALRLLPQTLVLYEAPTRLIATLEELLEALGDRPAAVARELTKLHEEVFRGTLSTALAWARAGKPRGEFTIVVGPPSPEQPADVSDDAVRAALHEALASGDSPRDAARAVAARLGIPRKRAYGLAIQGSGTPPDPDL